MLYALISLLPSAVVAVYPDIPNPLVLPDGRAVHGISGAWTDSKYSFVTSVVMFTPPVGQEVIAGTDTYSIVNGQVTQTYQTQAIPQPVYVCQLWQLQSILTAAQWTSVQNAIATLNNPAVTAFFQHGTNSIPSNSTTLLALGQAIGLTTAEIVALIQQASTVAIP